LHVVERRAGLGVAGEDRPRDRSSAAVPREQREVEVQARAADPAQQRAAQDLVVLDREQRARAEGREPLDPLRLAETARLLEAHAEAPGRAAQRTLPSVLAAVAVHADREHLVAARGEEVERGDGGVVLPAEDPPHAGDHDPSAASTAARSSRTTRSWSASG